MYVVDYSVNCIYSVKKLRLFIVLYCILNVLLFVYIVYCFEWFLKLLELVNVVFDIDYKYVKF